MKKVLVTGGAGFIGSEIVNKLFDIGEYEIIVLDSMEEQIHGNDYLKSYLFNRIKDKCFFIKGDVRDYDTVKKAINDCEYIIHLAAETGTGQSMYEINKYNEVNIMGTSNIFQAISSCSSNSKVRKIILSSSRAVYGEGEYLCPKCGKVHPKSRRKENMKNKDFNMYCEKCGSLLSLIPTDENCEVIPNSLYAFTKYAQEKMIETMCPALGIEYTIFRFQNVYGVGQSLKNPYTGILSIFSTLLLENKTLNIFEDGLESRDFVNVSDIADGVIAALSTSKTNNEIINLGSGIGTSVIEIANILKKIYNSNSKICVTGDFRIGDIAHNIADITKAKNLLGFTPKIKLEDGLNDFCKWVRGQETDNSKYEKSLKEMEDTGLFIRG